MTPYPYTNAHFSVEIEGLVLGGFSTVSGLEVKTEIKSVTEGGVNDVVYMLPGQTSSQEIVLGNGIVNSNDLWTWYQEVITGNIRRRNGTIYMMDTKGNHVLWWNVINAFPHSWVGPDFDAGTASVAIEKISLAHNGLSAPQTGAL